MTIQDQKSPQQPARPNGSGVKPGQKPHAAGSGSSTGDPGGARGSDGAGDDRQDNGPDLGGSKN
jgi:hypothetical protein